PAVSVLRFQASSELTALRLLACGTNWYLGAPPGPAHGPQLTTLSSSAKELIATVGLEARNANSVRHREQFEYFSRLGIDSPQVPFVVFPGSVPEFSVDPGHPGDEALGFDRAKNPACFRVDLMDLPFPILSYPKRPFSPREAGVTAARCRDRGEHVARLRIDLLDAISGNLKKVSSVESGSCIRDDIDRTSRLTGRRIENDKLVSGSKPNALTVMCDAIHAFDTWKWSVLTDDLGC